METSKENYILRRGKSHSVRSTVIDSLLVNYPFGAAVPWVSLSISGAKQSWNSAILSGPSYGCPQIKRREIPRLRFASMPTNASRANKLTFVPCRGPLAPLWRRGAASAPLERPTALPPASSRSGASQGDLRARSVTAVTSITNVDLLPPKFSPRCMERFVRQEQAFRFFYLHPWEVLCHLWFPEPATAARQEPSEDPSKAAPASHRTLVDERTSAETRLLRHMSLDRP